LSQPKPNPSALIFYQMEDGRTRLQVRLEGQTVWLSLNQLADLFQRDKSVISKHLKNVFEERELMPDSVVANFATTAADGKTYQVDHYNLEVIIAVGYRVKSWIARLDAFLTAGGQRILNHVGNISAEEAKLKAETEFDKFDSAKTPGPMRSLRGKWMIWRNRRNISRRQNESRRRNET
jgi:hypothetical protein